ncbi:class I SAM-dependent methyltransferase [Paenibacillus chitinolyticus]|uniref:Class I SAM-dependent methyltransferase n=1 Tax=Paenibacillus chitinolyticus TaxID=79263 RepID=A0A410WT45_9BACL|nr:class I SAM-dependent methyltransferase [Paenibacillus chitinolyticus]MCY9588740.1 methyltransferase domain-containing protein [Paenibacillus chitinolyticus]MCY9595756.1 methyltransferase domain-containing protein [Paenibacillus chitinolyticus]QAV17510.1 class I SAM-dependent methyltransferase [Paenibacillus chitinolyticus]
MNEAEQGKWDAGHYDTQMYFVSRLGQGVMDLLSPVPGESVLDLGCGTGTLAHEIALLGAQVTGVDFSEAMIEQARQNYPELAFEVGDARTYRSGRTFDAVFSNAALHWVPQADEAARTVAEALRPGGRFAAEFGGFGNVARIERAIHEAVREAGIDPEPRNPWYFPTIGEYTGVLERAGLDVRYAEIFDRPTPLPGGEQAIRHWLHAFAGSFFAGIDAATQERITQGVEERLRPALFRDGAWTGDYCRIRVLARKPLG